MIIAGLFKGRSLKNPKGSNTRPTTSLLRKSVFDIAKPFIEGARFLDLFAGSGAMGLEALSRGASHATFVEKNPKALACLQDNIKTLDVAKQTRVLSFDARMALARLLKEGALFDVIYLDPPYEAIPLYLEIITFLDTHPLMTNGGHLFIEEGLPSKLTLPPLTHFQKKDSRTFGRSQLHQLIYRS